MRKTPSFTGQINIRIDKELHKQLAIQALHQDISLNKLIKKKLSRTVIRPEDLINQTVENAE